MAPNDFCDLCCCCYETVRDPLRKSHPPQLVQLVPTPDPPGRSDWYRSPGRWICQTGVSSPPHTENQDQPIYTLRFSPSRCLCLFYSSETQNLENQLVPVEHQGNTIDMFILVLAVLMLSETFFVFFAAGSLSAFLVNLL